LLRNPQSPGRWHMFEEKREAVMAIEAAVSLLIPGANALSRTRRSLPSIVAQN